MYTVSEGITLTEELVGQYGEPYRRLIEGAMVMLNEQGPSWEAAGADVIDAAFAQSYIKGLISRAVSVEHR